MNDRQITYTNMFRAVQKFCTDHDATLNTYPFFTEHAAELQANISHIEQLDVAASADISGVTEDKDALEDALAKATLRLVGSLKLLYKKTKDQQHFNAIDFTRSQIFHTADNTLLTRATLVHEHASSNLAADPAYGITQELVDALNDLINRYKEVMRSPQGAITDRKFSKEDLRNTIDLTLKETLNEGLDIVLEMASAEHPDLYTQYLDARKLKG